MVIKKIPSKRTDIIKK